jgi:hypothetical protein
VVVQGSPAATANNVATCVETDKGATASQSCEIFQQSDTGVNTAVVLQTVASIGTGPQDATQYAGISQQSGSGANNATVTQTIIDATAAVGSSGGAEQQDGHQGSSVTQSATGAGNNTANVAQSLALAATAVGVGTIGQSQNADASEGPNTNSDVEQTSGSGTNSARLNQLDSLTALATGAAAGSQLQGSSAGTENGTFNQSSMGVSTIQGSQIEHQTETATPVHGSTSTVTQTQYGPLYLDPNQGPSNGSDTYNFNQSSDQHSNLQGVFQDDEEYGQCFTSGTCTGNQQISQNGQSSTNACGPMSSCDFGLTQTRTSLGTSSSTCGNGSADCLVGFPSGPPAPVHP